MRKNVYLGITSDNNACILYSLATFDLLEKNINEIEKSDFEHDATNWSGKDSIERTLSVKQISLTGKELILPEPIVFTGFDYDAGHKYDWECEIVKIAETTSD